MRANVFALWCRWGRYGLIGLYLGVVGFFFVSMSRFYEPGSGFSFLIAFGAKHNLPQVSELKPLSYLLEADGYGYDAQYYAQMAMHPSLRGEEISRAVDSLAYRGRRILTCWTAYVAGLGRPAWILQAFAVQNMVAWLILAVLLLYWFPPTNISNVFRWGGVLFCAGMCQSLRQALVDAPSLLLISCGVWAVQTNRRWLATGIFAVSGLARETNLLGAASLVRPDQRTWRHAGELVVRALLIGAPLALWMAYIHAVVGPAIDAGARNFNAPFLSYITHWRHTFAALAQAADYNPWPKINLWAMIALTTQFCFLAFRPRLQEAWWRVGACFAALMVVLGTAVWEGYPGATARVLLPMQMAFNVLVPYTRRWIVVLVLGNLSVLGVFEFLQPPPGFGYRLSGSTGMLSDAAGSRVARVAFDEAWYNTERKNDRYWRWARGDASFTVENPHAFGIDADVHFFVDGVDRRQVTVTQNGKPVWSGAIGSGDVKVSLTPATLAPGANTFLISTGAPPKQVGSGTDARGIAFAIRNLEIRLLRATPGP